LISECPVCHQALNVAKLHCRSCDITVEGNFTLGRFHTLSPEQLAFAETFIRCEGKINRVEEELHISYPTVRARLHEVIRALGYPINDEEKPPAIDRQAILAELAQGKITSEEAAQKLSGG
ncbi:MAG: DUF2089 domain-containing protein, partial [Chloroflexota bacterium]